MSSDRADGARRRNHQGRAAGGSRAAPQERDAAAQLATTGARTGRGGEGPDRHPGQLEDQRSARLGGAARLARRLRATRARRRRLRVRPPFERRNGAGGDSVRAAGQGGLRHSERRHRPTAPKGAGRRRAPTCVARRVQASRSPEVPCRCRLLSPSRGRRASGRPGSIEGQEQMNPAPAQQGCSTGASAIPISAACRGSVPSRHAERPARQAFEQAAHRSLGPLVGAGPRESSIGSGSASTTCPTGSAQVPRRAGRATPGPRLASHQQRTVPHGRGRRPADQPPGVRLQRPRQRRGPLAPSRAIDAVQHKQIISSECRAPGRRARAPGRPTARTPRPPKGRVPRPHVHPV